VKILADLIKEAKCLVIYTGAGVSTNASIPVCKMIEISADYSDLLPQDYRSMDGIWTKLEKGIAPPKKFDLEAARPTTTHMVRRIIYLNNLNPNLFSKGNCGTREGGQV